MKKISILLVTLLALTQFASATPEITYSSDDGGNWSYFASTTSGEGAFSFVQPIGIDGVQNATADALANAFIYIPNLGVSGLTEVLAGTGIYQGNVTPVSSAISIKDGNGNDILTGTLTTGGIFSIGTTAALYPTFKVDITVTSLPNAVNSDFINTLKVGDVFDFDLTLQGAAMAPMILNNQDNREGSTLSGSMSLVPEPATLALLGFGGLLLRKRN